MNSNKEGVLRIVPSGRWAICRPGRMPYELNSGTIFHIEVDGQLKETRIEYRHFSGGGGQYYSVDGYKLGAGLRAAFIAKKRGKQ